MSVKLQAPLGGSVELSPANTASNYTLTVPAQTGTVVATDSSGNVGIGTSSPSYKLDVTTTSGIRVLTSADLSAGGASYVRFGGSNNGAAGYIGYGGSSNTLDIVNGLSGPLTFNTANTEKMRISAAGYITTGTASSSPYNATTSATANMFVNSDGGLYRSTSSAKYKTNIQDATFGIADVLKLRPVTYEGKSEVDSGKVFAGLIAEEVHDAGLTQFVQYAEDGTPDALNYANMVSLAFKAIQEQQAIITELKTRIEALESK